MTIVAYRAGVMASDACWNDDGLVYSSATKIYHQGSLLIGTAGSCDDRELLNVLKKVRRVEDMPPLAAISDIGADLSAIIVFPDRRVFLIDTEFVDMCEVKFPYCAVGSGKQIALGTFHHGGSAVEAVEAACAHNVYCRPPVFELEVKKHGNIQRASRRRNR